MYTFLLESRLSIFCQKLEIKMSLIKLTENYNFDDTNSTSLFNVASESF
jgi:hypothetical protein